MTWRRVVGVFWLAGLAATAWLAPTRPRVVLADAHSARFSPDGTVVAVSSMASDTSRTVDVATGRVVEPLDTPLPLVFHWHRDAGGVWRVIIGPPPDPAVALVPPPMTPPLALARAAPLAVVHTDGRRAVTIWEEDKGRRVVAVHDAATGRAPCGIRFWEVRRTATDATLETYYPHGLAVSPDGRWLAAVPWRQNSFGTWAADSSFQWPVTPPMPAGLAVYDAATGRVVADHPAALAAAFTADGSAVYAINRWQGADALVRCDLATGTWRTVTEHARPGAAPPAVAKLLEPRWLLPPTPLTDSRVVAARVAAGGAATLLHTVRMEAERLAGAAVRVPVEFLDAETGRAVGSARLVDDRFAPRIAPDGRTLAAGYSVTVGGVPGEVVELWDVPPRRSLPWAAAAGLAWTAVVAAGVGVAAVARRAVGRRRGR